MNFLDLSLIYLSVVFTGLFVFFLFDWLVRRLMRRIRP